MAGEAKAGTAERAGPDVCGPAADGLARELACLTALGALTAEETEAFSSVLADLHAQVADPDRRDRSRMARLLAADLDLAFRRLGSGV